MPSEKWRRSRITRVTRYRCCSHWAKKKALSPFRTRVLISRARRSIRSIVASGRRLRRNDEPRCTISRYPWPRTHIRYTYIRAGRTYIHPRADADKGAHVRTWYRKIARALEMQRGRHYMWPRGREGGRENRHERCIISAVCLCPMPTYVYMRTTCIYTFCSAVAALAANFSYSYFRPFSSSRCIQSPVRSTFSDHYPGVHRRISLYYRRLSYLLRLSCFSCTVSMTFQ